MATALQHFLTQRLADAQGDAAAQEIHALRTLSAADPSATARELVRAAEAAARAGDEAAAEGHLWRLWRLLCDAARSAPDAQEALAALVDAISQLPDVEREEGGAAVVWDMKMWADMPIWHAHWTEWEFNGEGAGSAFYYG
ncbi:Major facilitator superfamily domain general substrate transporter [Neofusicoccum parvum]|nr:Major facilitator superfamily domain general substrate transporter [Neofusicoccum parvum]